MSLARLGRAAAALLLLGGCGAPEDPTPPAPPPAVDGPTTTVEAGQRLELVVVSLSERVPIGQEAVLRVRTAPTARATVEVRYAGGGRVQVLESRTIGADGFGAWTWRLDGDVPVGRAEVVIRAAVIGRTVETKAAFTVL